jgi:hypothetical protein
MSTKGRKPQIKGDETEIRMKRKTVRWLKESKRKAKFGGGGDLIVSYTIL